MEGLFSLCSQIRVQMDHCENNGVGVWIEVDSLCEISVPSQLFDVTQTVLPLH